MMRLGWIGLLLILWRLEAQGQPKLLPSMVFIAEHPKTGQTLEWGLAEGRFIMASAMKVLSLGLIFDSDQTQSIIRTPIAWSGNLDHGQLRGDLIISGQFDPTWMSKRVPEDMVSAFHQILNLLCDNDIHEIQGDLLIQGTGPATQYISRYWLWEDIGNYYGSGAWPINVLDNSIELEFIQSKDSWKLLGTSPDLSRYTWKSEVVQGPPGSGDQAFVFGSPYGTNRIIRGTLPKDKDVMKIKASSSNPMLDGGILLRAFLEENGIRIKGKVRISSENGSPNRVLGYVESPAMDWMIKQALLHSDNLYTEALVRHIYDFGGYDAFLDQLNEDMAEFYSVDDMEWHDACGLSPLNSFMPEEVMKAWKKLILSKPEFTFLIPAFEDSSLSRWLKGNGHIKSGSMKGVQTYLGKTENGWLFYTAYQGPKSRYEVRKMMAECINSLTN